MKIKSQYKFDIYDLTCDEFTTIHKAVERYAKEVDGAPVPQYLLDAFNKGLMTRLPVEEED